MLRLTQNNDEEREFRAFRGQDDFDLTEFDLSLVMKASETTPDSDPGTVILTSAAGAITKTTATDATVPSLVTVAFPHADLVTAAPSRWFRLDAIRDGEPTTIAKGPLVIEAS
jgi:hypothetical protein